MLVNFLHTNNKQTDKEIMETVFYKALIKYMKDSYKNVNTLKKEIEKYIMQAQTAL